VEQKLSEIGSALNGMSCAPERNRLRHQLSDSGVDLEAEEDAEEDNNSSHDGRGYHHIATSFDSSTASSMSNPTSPFNDSPYLTATLDILTTSPDTTPLPPPQFSAAAAAAVNHPQRLRTQMISLVRSVSVAQADLRRRCAEAHGSKERHQTQHEGRESALDALRAENESLRTDLGLESCELLFLKLQMKAVELSARSPRCQEEDADGQEQNSDQILGNIEQWQEDWQDIEDRIERRNSGYDEDNALPKRRMPAGFEVGESTLAAPRRFPWRLETTKDEDGSGCVMSITIKRVLPIDEGQGGEAGAEHDDVEVQDSSSDFDEKHEETLAVVVEDPGYQTEPAPVSDGATESDAEEHDADHIDDAISLQSEVEETEPVAYTAECKPIVFAEQSTQTDGKTKSYVDQSTQTDVTETPVPSLSSSDELEYLGELDTDSAQDEAHLYEKSIPQPDSPSERRKSAWNELWNGLSSFAGMEDDD
jgi:hypothetical protein